MIDENTVRRLHSKGFSDHEIANEIGASQTGVCRARQRIGLHPHFSFGPQGLDENPKDIYARSLERSKDWKALNMVRVRKMFRQWQKDHREQRNAYMRKTRQKITLFTNIFVCAWNWMLKLLGVKKKERPPATPKEKRNGGDS